MLRRPPRSTRTYTLFPYTTRFRSCIIPDALPAETIAALDADLASTFARTPFCEGGFYGATTTRFGRLLARSERAAALVQHPTVLAGVDTLLSPWSDCLQPNTTPASAVHPRSPSPPPPPDHT